MNRIKRSYVEWAEYLPEPIRSQYLENLTKPIPSKKHVKHTQLSEAIFHGFNWSQTPQRHEYWQEIRKNALEGKYDGNKIILEML